MFTFDDRAIIKYNKRLKKLRKNGIPLAVASTLDNMAYKSREKAIKLFEQEYTIRSTWTQRGMLYERTKKNVPIKRMEARQGNIRDYAAMLEHGGTAKPTAGQLLEIPALGARIAKSKKKRIAKRYSIPQLQRLRRLPAIKGTPRRRFAAMLNMARKEKYYGPFLITKQEAGGEKMPIGIFMLTGAGRRQRQGGKIIMIRKLQATAQVPGRPFVSPAGIAMGRQMDRLYIENAKRVLKKYGGDIK